MIKYIFSLYFLAQAAFGIAQSFEKFIQKECIQTVALCAHPGLILNESNSTATIFHKGVIFDLHYLDEVNTILTLYLEDGIITKIESNYDNYFFPAFTTVSLVQIFVNAQTEEELNPLQKQIKRYYENLYGVGIEDFDGAQLTTAILAYTWADFVIQNDRTDYSGSIGTTGTPELVKIVDGITIEGQKIFVDRVVQSLSIIKTYDPDFYAIFLANSSTKYNVVKGISMNTKYSNTIDDGHYLALHKSHEYNSDEEHNPFCLASVIVHETVHLHQYLAYTKWFECKISNYLFGYGYDPVAIAKKELDAHKYQLRFLNMLPPDTPNINLLKTYSEIYITDYTTAMDAGYLMFDSHGSDCGEKCKQQACAKMKPVYDRYKEKALMGILYRLICPK